MWNETTAKIFVDFVKELNHTDIKYFVLRNYEGLPEKNPSKDIDIIIEPGTFKKAEALLLKSFKQNGMEYQYQCQFQFLHCMHGINLTDKIGIHIDLIEGYCFKGYEIFSFDELYAHAKEYNGFFVLDDFFNGVMIYVYKQFGYGKPKLKDEYKEAIYTTNRDYPEFKELIAKLTTAEFAQKMSDDISRKDFASVLVNAPILTKHLKRYTFKHKPFKTIKNSLWFLWLKFRDIVILYNKRAMTIGLMAPDGTGKTTFLNEVTNTIERLFVNDPEDGRVHVYHFRPTLLPNLGEVGEKATAGKVKQDKNFEDPHRSKPANPFSSLIRITYYWLDYVLGWMVYVRKDVHFERFSVFDRYSYDLYVDPRRTKLNLPDWVRKLYVKMMHHPKIVFCLKAKPETIYKRKQELTLDEIKRQLDIYEKVKSFGDNFVTLDAEKKPEDMADFAMKHILDKFCKKL